MMRRSLILAITTAASLSAFGQTARSFGERTVVAESRFDVTNAPRQAELGPLAVDFPPGTWTSRHTHCGRAINPPIQGEFTLRNAGKEHFSRAGEAWTDKTREVYRWGQAGS